MTVTKLCQARAAHRGAARRRTLRRALVIAVALLLLAPLDVGGLGDQSARAAHTGHGSGWASLSGAGQGVISATLGRDDAGYWVHSPAAVPALDNAAQHLRARFTPTGPEVSTGNSQWGLGLAAVGRGGELAPVPAATPVPEANRVDYRRGSIQEWYLNGPAGLEQGFTLAERPGGDPGQRLTLALGAPESLTGKSDPGGTGMVLNQGSDSLAYRGLSVSDATGQSLPAHLGLDGGQVLIRVDDQAAQYPVTVDPFIQAAKLIASDGAANNQLGVPVAISGDIVVASSSNAAVGSNAAQGAAWVFVAPTGPAGTLTQVAKLIASDGLANDRLGGSVGIDGNTIVLGAHNAKVGTNNNQGAAYVFVAPSGGWAGTQTETAKLTASDGGQHDQLGQSVAVSGNTVIAGAYIAPVGTNNNQGAAYVFAAPWTGTVVAPQHESAKLTAADGAANDWFGDSMAASGDIVVIDAAQATVNGNVDAGAMYVFVAPPGGWVGPPTAPMHEAAKLTATDGAVGDGLGRNETLAISGNTVVAGAYQAQIGTHGGQGAAYVFVAPAGGWSGPQTEATKLTASDGTSNDGLGAAVGISGNTVVVGAPAAQIGANIEQGAVYVFVQPAGGWAGARTETAKLTAADGAFGDQFGSGVAIDGNTVVAGAPRVTLGNNTWQGAAYLFTQPTATTTTLGVTPASPATPGTAETLVAMVNPAGAGTVQFLDGATPLGAPVAVASGVASLTTTLPLGAHSLSSVFTPTDPGAFAGSTSAAVSYVVAPKRPLCIRWCG
jgi:hypothetical protein